MAPAANDSCSSLHAARSLCLRPFNSENQYCRFRAMTYRLENRVVWKIAAGALMEGARILFDVIAS
jgi:hypothetical protein